VHASNAVVKVGCDSRYRVLLQDCKVPRISYMLVGNLHTSKHTGAATQKSVVHVDTKEALRLLYSTFSCHVGQ
jgi:hypothetical protein